MIRDDLQDMFHAAGVTIVMTPRPDGAIDCLLDTPYGSAPFVYKGGRGWAGTIACLAYAHDCGSETFEAFAAEWSIEAANANWAGCAAIARLLDLSFTREQIRAIHLLA